MRYSGLTKLGVCDRLANSWRDLADALEIPLADRQTFDSGEEARGVWEWLERRDQLGRLRRALIEINRQDIVPLLEYGRTFEADPVATGPAAGDGPATVSAAPPLGRRHPDVPLRGRDQLMRYLKNLLTDTEQGGRVQVVYGLGGCGKTTIALELAHHATVLNMDVWWVGAESPSTMVMELHAVAGQLGLSASDLKRNDVPDQLWRRLAEHGRPWLLVLDNVDEPEVLAGGGSLPDGTGWVRPVGPGRGTVLITSRDGAPQLWGTWCERHQIAMLPASDAAQVLLDWTRGLPVGSEQDARALAVRLAGFPLALALAGAYLAESHSVPWHEEGTIRTFSTYRSALDTGAAEILSGRPEYQATRRAWELSLDLLVRDGMPLARPLLRLLSCLADSAIPYHVLLDPVAMAATSLFPELTGAGLWHLLERLANLCLVELSPHGDELPEADGDLPVLRLHPLVREASRQQADMADRLNLYHELIASLLARATSSAAGDPKDPSRWRIWQSLAPHAFHMTDTAVIEPSSLSSRSAQAIVRASLDATEHLHARGHYGPAEIQLRRILDRCRTVLGGDSDQALLTRQYLARILHDGSRYDQAEAEYRAVLELQQQRYGNEHPDTLRTRHNLADMIRIRGRYNTAENELRAVIAVEHDVLGADHEDTLTARYELARVLHDRGQYAEAEAELRSVLTARERLLGQRHLATLIARHNVARVLHDLGRYGEAAVLYWQVLTDCRRVLGDPYHPEILFIRHNLARLTFDRGEVEAGYKLYEEVAQDLRNVFRADHPEVLFVEYNMARAVHERGDRAEAEERYRRVLGRQQRTLGMDHPDTVATRRGLARLRHEAGDLDQAEAEYHILLSAALRSVGPNHRLTLTLRGDVAQILIDRGYRDIGASRYRALFEHQCHVLGEEHPDTVRIRRALDPPDSTGQA